MKKLLAGLLVFLVLAAGTAFALGSVSKTVTAENTYSDSIAIFGKFNVSISGISGDTVHVQRSFDAGTLWKDVESYTADKEDAGEEIEHDVIYRIGVKTGNYSAGTILLRISQ